MGTQLRDLITRIAPNWLQPNPNAPTLGFRLLYGIATVCDGMVEAGVQAIQARMPGYGTPTALPYLARDRRLRRGLSESDAAFSSRLQGYRPDWRRAGSPFALMRQIQGYLTPNRPRVAVVNTHGTWYVLEANGTDWSVPARAAANWDWDSTSGGDPAAWARFWVLIYSEDQVAGSPFWRDGTWNDGELWGSNPNATWGSTATLEQVETIRALVDDWKGAHEVCQNIVIVFDPSSTAFDPLQTAPPTPDGSWGHHSKNVGGVQVPARSADAIYWDGVA